MRPQRRVPAGAARVGLAVLSAVVLMLTGTAWWATRDLRGGLNVSQALGLDAPRSTDGSMNILLIGLDSRKDLHGNDLPQEILDQLHAGGSDEGGYNTNTLILAHVGADNRVVAFSIPRDDYVPVSGITGYDHIKIKEAYGLAKAQAEEKLNELGVTDGDRLEQKGREAGRAATLGTVRSLTGVPIDYFAEVDLAGFYDLAQALGGVRVCLNHAVSDDYSGADFPAGPQRLDAAQALAFVRQRHGLDNGDLDRTHRQQAFLVSVMHDLAQAGTFTDVDKMSKLMDVVRKDIVLSQGWGEEQLRHAGDIASGANVTYQTLPVVRYDHVDGQDVNIVDTAIVQARVATAFGQDIAAQPGAKPAPPATVDVINAGSTEGLAAGVSRALGARGYLGGQVRNAARGEPTATAVSFGTQAEAAAHDVATLLAIDAEPAADPELGATEVRVTLGDEYVAPAGLTRRDGSTGTGQPDEPAVPASARFADMSSPSPDAGKPISGGAVPCVN